MPYEINPSRRRSFRPHLLLSFRFVALHSKIQHTEKKDLINQRFIRSFWSEWRDLNPRHPAPKRRRDRFSIGKQSLPALSVPVKILSGAHVSTVSARSGSRYGRICGHKRNRLRETKTRKRFFVPLIDVAQLLVCCLFHPFIPNMFLIIGFASAHRAGTMYFSFCKSPGLAVRPCENILLPANAPENTDLSVNSAAALHAVISAVSVQLYCLLDSFCRLQESSRIWTLLQATWLPRIIIMLHNKIFLRYWFAV